MIVSVSCGWRGLGEKKVGHSKLLLAPLNMFLSWVLEQKGARVERVVPFRASGGPGAGDSSCDSESAAAVSLLEHQAVQQFEGWGGKGSAGDSDPSSFPSFSALVSSRVCPWVH